MSKKSESTHASTQPTSHADSPWHPTSEFSKSAAEWLAEALADARVAVTKGTRVQFTSALLVRAARTLKAKIHSPKNTALRAAAWACGLDGNFWEAVDTQVAAVEANSKSVPKDLRTIETITPAQTAGVDAAAQYLADLRVSLARYAKSKGMLEQLELLGRGEPVGASAQAVVASYDTFLTNAPQRQALLRGAAIGETILAEMRKKRDFVQEVYVQTGQKADEKAALPAEIAVARRALEGLLDTYAGLIGIQLAGNTALRTQALKGAPRRPERRGASGDGEGSGDGNGSGDGSGDGDSDASGDGEAEGEGTADAPHDEGAGTAPEASDKKPESPPKKKKG